jgi:hypothetical protein
MSCHVVVLSVHSPDALVVRPAESTDLDGIVVLTKERRRQLARWEEFYWRPRAGIDELHPHFLRWCIEQNAACQVLVAVENATVVGCLFAHARPDHVFLDDFCVAGERWSDVGVALLNAAETDGLICAPTKDLVLGAWLGTTNSTLVSRFFSLRAVGDSDRLIDSGAIPTDLPSPPRHAFGPIDATTENGLRVMTSEGYALGSAPVSPPPYDPGGPTTVVDRIIGTDRAAVLEATLAAANRRGDVQVIVVCGVADVELETILTARCVSQPVNLWAYRHHVE